MIYHNSTVAIRQPSSTPQAGQSAATSLRLSRDDASRTFYDVTVVNTLTAQAIFTAEKAATPMEGFLSVLRAAFDRKVAKHRADVSLIGGRFVPLVVSTTGVWYPDSLWELRKIATYVSTRRGNSDSDSWKLHFAKVGCAMARGNELVLASARRALTAATEGVDEWQGDFVGGGFISARDL